MEAQRKIENLQIADFSLQILNQSVEELLSYGYDDGLGGRDATIFATMKLQEINRIVSHDDVFKRLASRLDLEVIDPAATN